MSIPLFSKTPTVTVLDNRALTVRDIAYHRHPDTPGVTDERITRHRYDARGFLTQSADPRLHDAGRANFRYLTDLAGGVLRTRGVDNGTRVILNDAAGRSFIAAGNISTDDDGTEDLSQAVTSTWQYEDDTLPGRPLSVTEQVAGGTARVVERFVYAGDTLHEKRLNLAGQCLCHYEPARRVRTDSVALTGGAFSVTHWLLNHADDPTRLVDWQGETESEWEALLETEYYSTVTVADATGRTVESLNAGGHQQRMAYDVAGRLSGSWLTVKGGAEQTIVASLTYSAAGQKLQEEHGNGVVTTYTYEAETQRLTGIKTERPAGHASGAKVLQDLRYEYDPVGNVLKVRNDAEPTRFWRNQKVVPENTYTYDSLYQLVNATGREMANGGPQGSSRPSGIRHLTDGSVCTNYSRTYTYDSAGNLTQVRHSPATGSGYTTDIIVSDHSNRGVLSTLTKNPADVDALFTAGGQQKQLQPGQSLVWTPRNELLKVSPVVRDGRANDEESYRYDAGSQRVLKVSVQHTGNSTHTQRTLYLPGLELRTTKAGDVETESLQVITVGEAGRAQVQVLHWASGKPDGMGNDQVRYSYDNLSGSCGLELDAGGNIISAEEYYPYGGTAVWTARSMVEGGYKTIRYSGKERDATGLYYYGYRYYQPWAGRWLSADPAETVDGLNLFRMVRNNPGTLKDEEGLAPLRTIEHLSEEDMKDIKEAISEMKGSTRGTLSDREKTHQKARGFAEVQAKYHEEFASHKELPASILDVEDKEIIRTYSRNQTLFNNYLKQGIGIESNVNGNAKKLDAALNKMPNATEISYRGYGVSKGVWDNLSPGDIVTNEIFMSTSLSLSYAKAFAEPSSPEREGVVLKIMGRTGKNISLLSRFQEEKGESEILFSPGSNFNIIAIKKHRDINYAIVREVKDNPEQKRSIYDGRLLQPPVHESTWVSAHRH